MAACPLNLAPSLHPWRLAGIRAFLLDADTVQIIRGQLAQKPGITARSASSIPAQTPVPARWQREHPAAIQAETKPQPKPAPIPKRQINVHDWSPFWQNLLQHTPKTPKIVWTYAALAEDIVTKKNDAHRQILQNLIKDIPLPPGSHAFWALNCYPMHENDPATDADMFLNGITLLNPKAVFLMTGTLPQELEQKWNPMTLLCPQFHICSVCVLHNIDDYVRDTSGTLYKTDMLFLSGYLRNILY